MKSRGMPCHAVASRRAAGPRCAALRSCIERIPPVSGPANDAGVENDRSFRRRCRRRLSSQAAVQAGTLGAPIYLVVEDM